MKDASDQDIMDEKHELYFQATKSLKYLTDKNGYIDEFIGSWHRLVDAQEAQAESMKNIADSLEIIAETYKIQIIK